MRALALAALLASGCANDLCGDALAACVALTVGGSGEIDTLQITASGSVSASRVAPTFASVAQLPVYVAVDMSASFRGGPLHLDVAAFRRAKPLGVGSVDLTLNRSDHVAASVTIGPPGQPGPDLAMAPPGPDMAFVCQPDLGTLASDPHNCGSCGHDCRGGACSAGQCQPSVVATSSSTTGVAVDGANVYFSTGSSGVSRVSLSGGPPVPIATGSLQYLAVAGTTLIADDSSVWLSTVALPNGGAVNRVVNTQVSTVAVDAGHVYWASSMSMSSLPLPLAAGTPTNVASTTNAVLGLASDGTTLFFTTTAGQIGTVTLPSGSANLVTTVTNARAIVVDAGAVYVTTTNAIVKLPRSGATLGAPSTMSLVTNTPLALAADGNSLYWTDAVGVMRLAK